MGKTGAIFNIEKLDWMNGYYLRQMSLDDASRYGLCPISSGWPAARSDPLSEDAYERRPTRRWPWCRSG